MLLKFLHDNMRPFSFNDIHERCAKSESRSAVQKAIDSLVSREKVIEKQIGKQKIYFLNQGVDNDDQEVAEISQLEQKVDNLQKSLKEKEERIKKYEIELKQLSSKPSQIDLEIQQDDLKIKVLTLTEKLDLRRASQGNISESDHDIKNIQDKYSKMLAEFRKRKRICNNMIDSILEGYPKTKKQLLEDIGVETDEMVNFSLNV
ncbi:homologous-pairing protein 2 homolog isoform X2 [Hermetia illucens]|nr:homologous-pairing protein 2 homolog isoform X2 [Hermetia illucens]